MGFFNKTSELKKNYNIDNEALGSGNFAVVKKCTRKKDNEVFAVKIIDKAKVEDMGDIEREIEIMGKIDHPNVIKLVEIFDEPKKMNLVMELVTGGELFDKIVALGNYTEKDAAKVMKTLCEALDYLHERQIVHRDLKPENILLLDKSPDAPIKVADFGLARVISQKDLMKTACGTPGYVAPEVLQNKGYSSGAVDLWSAGVILYILLCGFPPFYEEELPALFDQILKARYDFPSPWWDTISDGAKDLVRKLLTVDPKKRYTAKQVLGHPYVTHTHSHTPPLARAPSPLVPPSSLRSHAPRPGRVARARGVTLLRLLLLLLLLALARPRTHQPIPLRAAHLHVPSQMDHGGDGQRHLDRPAQEVQRGAEAQEGRAEADGDQSRQGRSGRPRGGGEGRTGRAVSAGGQRAGRTWRAGTRARRRRVKKCTTCVAAASRCGRAAVIAWVPFDATRRKGHGC